MDYFSDRDFGDETDFNNEDEGEPDIGVREPNKPISPLLEDGAEAEIIDDIEDLCCVA